MNAAVIKLVEDLGVEPESIMLDDFGGYRRQIELPRANYAVCLMALIHNLR